MAPVRTTRRTAGRRGRDNRGPGTAARTARGDARTSRGHGSEGRGTARTARRRGDQTRGTGRRGRGDDNPYAPGRGRGRRARGQKKAPIAGIVSICCAGGALVCVAIIIAAFVSIFQGGDAGTAAGIALFFVFLMWLCPIVGIICGAIGVSDSKTNKVPAVVGLCLNGGLLLLFLLSAISNANRSPPPATTSDENIFLE